MNKPITIRDKTGERTIDLYPQGDPKIAESTQRQLHQIGSAQPVIYTSEPTRSHTEERTNSRDRAHSILLLAAGVLLINLPISLGLAWAAGWGLPAWSVGFGTIQAIAFIAIYRSQLRHSPAGIEIQRQDQDHEFRLQQQADAHKLRTMVVEHMLGTISARQIAQHNAPPQLMVNKDNQVKP